ncbi:hypothetical protein MPPM_4805 [Methylorubrum populi]|uniref:Uncharacterized protein n=1 Tax=Methylorubrum populi TaxID=223967 RepID=A0A160PMY4_9HYPH|nr:hypothetical protein MPPM_4805 [Methylorubrum populi]
MRGSVAGPARINQFADVAQMAEHPPCKRAVAGSIPALGSKLPAQASDSASSLAPLCTLTLTGLGGGEFDDVVPADCHLMT